MKQPREAKFSASKTRTWESLFAVMTLNDPLQKVQLYKLNQNKNLKQKCLHLAAYAGLR